ncbi:hypothetical protein [Pseudomonas rhodesiae]|uniref:hypothetical protein n=1 Tax=Pseudomonas rhodesiae TaxID=76760 RepID=UPI00241FA686|nr:hypothetical protein [Pseudomonas rhodesiae]
MPGIYRHVPPNARFWPIAAGRRIRIRRTKDNMIRRHYEMWINEDGPDVVGLLQLALKLSPVTALL